MDLKHIGTNIKNARNKINQTQKQVADQINIGKSYYSEIERGLKLPSLEKLISISQYLNSSPSDIITINEAEFKSFVERFHKDYLSPLNEKEFRLIKDVVSTLSKGIHEESLILLEHTIDMSLLGGRLKSARLKNSFSQEMVARKVKLTPSFVARLERGVNIPTLETLIKLSEVLDTSISELLIDYNSQGNTNLLKQLYKDIEFNEIDNFEATIIIENIKLLSNYYKNRKELKEKNDNNT